MENLYGKHFMPLHRRPSQTHGQTQRRHDPIQLCLFRLWVGRGTTVLAVKIYKSQFVLYTEL